MTWMQRGRDHLLTHKGNEMQFAEVLSPEEVQSIERNALRKASA